MEEFRILERKCLRVCLRVSQPGPDVCDKILSAKVPKIDSFMIKLTHDCFSKLTLHTNALIENMASLDASDIRQQIDSGYIFPQIFTYLDTKGHTKLR